MTLDHDIYIASLKSSQNYKAQPYQYASPSKQILKSTAKPYPPCSHYGFNDHRPDDCRNCLECEICGGYEQFTLGHNHFIQVRGGVLDESSQSSESSIRVSCTTCGSSVNSTTDHIDFEYFKRYTSGSPYSTWTMDAQGRGISQNFSSPYTPEQNGIAERKNRTLIEVAQTMMNGLVLSKNFWTKDVKIASYIFIHNHKDHLGKFDAKADDGYFLGYLFVSKAFRVFNTRRQQIEETYHVTFDEILEAPQSQDTNQASTSSYPNAHDRWLRDQHIELVNIIGDLREGMLTRRWVDAMQEELNQFYRNNVWTLVSLPHRKIVIGSKWVFRNKKDKHGIVTKNKARLVALIVRKNKLTMMKPLHHLTNPLMGLKNSTLGHSRSGGTSTIHKEHTDLVGKPVNDTLYRGMIGSLMYLNATRPDIQFSTCLCTLSLGLRYPKCSGFDLKGYSDLDYAGFNGYASDMAEYVIAAGCCANILWMKSQLSDYDIHYKMMHIFCDNTSSIAISNNPVLHSRTKHIDIRYHFIKDYILKGDIELHFISIEYYLADIFTKSLDKPTFTILKAELGMLNIE
ncbi:retrovirus-related pol polyprotein from transposon TNT 1-94 [Tanacetum coccineum]